MKKMVISSVLMLCALSALAQSTARKFVLKNSADGQSELTCYLPQNPTGRCRGRLCQKKCEFVRLWQNNQN